jgi:dTDP-4-dehydrorhamnose 3,5-epimerase-like enzyme
MTRFPVGQVLRLSEIVAPDEAVSGRIVVLDCAAHLPFEVKRVYWIHGMRQGEQRGGHAHRSLTQAVVAIAGRVSFELDDGVTRRTHLLERPNEYLIVPPGNWRDFTALEPGSALLVLASAPYEEADYIRDYDAFLKFRGRG